MANTSSAYDLSAFQPQSQQQKPQLKVVSRKSSKRALSAAFAPKSLGAFSIVVTLICLMVYNQVCLNEVTGEINAIQTSLTELESEYGRLNSDLGSLTSLHTVGEMAQEMGMARRDKYQTEYVSLYGEDRIEQIQPDSDSRSEGTSVASAGWLRSLVEYITGS